MKEEPALEEAARPGGAASPPRPLPELGLLQHMPTAHLGLLGHQGSGLLPPAALQAALMAGLAAQQASQLQYQQALLGGPPRLPPHLPPSSQLLGLQQQREALLAWSKLAAQSSAARFLGSPGVLPHPGKQDGLPPGLLQHPQQHHQLAKLDDSGIQTSPKPEPPVTSGAYSGGGTGGLLAPYLRPELTSGTSPSPTSGSPPGNGTGRPPEKKTNGKESGGREKVFVCQVCNRSFGYKHVLQNHERTHTGEKPFECKECHKRFTRDHHLKTHMRLHTGEKPYHCAHCDRQFVQVANLRRHLRVHTGERPYACEMCESRFSDSNQLKAHMLIHKGEKPFKCENCFGTFRRRHHLMHHKCSKEEPPLLPMGLFPPGLLGTPSHDDDRPLALPMRSSPPSLPPGGDDEALDVELANSETRSEASSGDRLRSGGSGDDRPEDQRRRSRKQKETRRLVRPAPHQTVLPLLTSTVTSPAFTSDGAPEQTEPEDLSCRRRSSADDEEEDEEGVGSVAASASADSSGEQPPAGSV